MTGSGLAHRQPPDQCGIAHRLLPEHPEAMVWPITVTLPDGAAVPGELHEQRETYARERWWCLVRVQVWGAEIGDYIDARLMWAPARCVHRVADVDYTGVPTRRRSRTQWSGDSPTDQA